MSGKRSRDKGARSERALVNILRDAGLDAVRVPLSGACEGFKGDVIIRGLIEVHDVSQREADFYNYPKRIESKVRANGWKLIYRYLEGNDALAIKSDGNPWLIVVPLDEWVKGQ